MLDFRKRPRSTLAAAIAASALVGVGGGAATYAALPESTGRIVSEW